MEEDRALLIWQAADGLPTLDTDHGSTGKTAWQGDFMTATVWRLETAST